MVDKQKLIIVILIIAILLSVISIVISLSISDFKPIFVSSPKQQASGGGIQIGIEPYQAEGLEP